MTPSLGGDRPALLAGALDEHLVGGELVAEDAEAAALELLELARGERGPHRAELLAELRAEHRQMRLHVQLRRLDVAELDLLHAQLLAQLVGVARRERRALDDEPPQRLAQLQPRGRPAPGGRAPTTRRTSAISASSVLVGLARLRPAGEMHRRRADLPSTPRTRICQRCSVRNGITGATTRRPCTSATQSACSATRRRPRSAAASGGCTSWRRRRRTPRRRGSTSTVRKDS